MMIGLEKKLLGGSVTVLLVVPYIEICDLRLQIKSLERRLDQHIEFLKEVSDYCDELKNRNSDRRKIY